MEIIKFTLGDTLKELKITNNKLAVESKIRPGTIKDLVDGRSKSINFATIIAIVTALNRISNEKNLDKHYGIDDVFTIDNVSSPTNPEV